MWDRPLHTPSSGRVYNSGTQSRYRGVGSAWPFGAEKGKIPDGLASLDTFSRDQADCARIENGGLVQGKRHFMDAQPGRVPANEWR